MSQCTGPSGSADRPRPKGPVLRSRDLAEIANTTPRALRHYHELGLLPDVPRDPNGYRRYGADDVVRLLRIRQLSASGVPLRKIADILDQDLRSREDFFTELDRDLEKQAEKITAQRRTLAELRRSAFHSLQFSPDDGRTNAQEFDQDVWTLLTATGEIDTDTATKLLDALRTEPLNELATAWYRDFESLEGRTSVDEGTADRLALRMVEFAEVVMEATGLPPADDELPLMELVEQLHVRTLSPAQQEVWTRLLFRIGSTRSG